MCKALFNVYFVLVKLQTECFIPALLLESEMKNRKKTKIVTFLFFFANWIHFSFSLYYQQHLTLKHKMFYIKKFMVPSENVKIQCCQIPFQHLPNNWIRKVWNSHSSRILPNVLCRIVAENLSIFTHLFICACSSMRNMKHKVSFLYESIIVRVKVWKHAWSYQIVVFYFSNFPFIFMRIGSYLSLSLLLHPYSNKKKKTPNTLCSCSVKQHDYRTLKHHTVVVKTSWKTVEKLKKQ